MVAISDSRGGVFNSRGIDPLKAMRYKERSGTVVGMPGTSRISNDDLLTMKCDILIPAALENVDHAEQCGSDQGENHRGSGQRTDDSSCG